MMGFGFTNKDVKDDNFSKGGYSPIPADRYTVVVSKMEEKQTSTGGIGWSTTYEVVDGNYKGRLIFDFINTKNKSEVAQNIGRARIKKIAEATGHSDIPDPQDLMYKPFDVEVVVNRDDYKSKLEGAEVMRNEVKKFYANKPMPAVQAVAAAVGGGTVVENVTDDEPLPF